MSARRTARSGARDVLVQTMEEELHRPYFHAKKIGDRIETSGSASCVLGHKIQRSNLSKVDGVFAEWSWDGSRLVVRNDRYGLYPLFYFCREGEVCLSPSIVRLIVEGAPTGLDEAGLAVFLRLGFFIGEDTPFSSIRALPPDVTFEWSKGRLLTLSGKYIFRKPQSLSRDGAIDAYSSLLETSVHRRLPPDEHWAVPLSGGRDSRHILLALDAAGCRPNFCITMRHFPPRPNQDEVVAAELASALRLPHIVLDQPASWFMTEWVKNVKTNLCSDEHAWMLRMGCYLEGRVGILYDGIGGEVLSAGVRLTARRLHLFESGKVRELASELLWENETTLMRVLAGDLCRRVSRDLAITHLGAEVAKHVEASNPVQSLFFWNRTRREIALSPYGLMPQRTKVFAPYLDHDVYDFLASLPASMVIDREFHTDTIRRAYPQYAHIRFERKDAEPQDGHSHYARFGRELARYAVPNMATGLTRTSYLVPRLLGCLVSKKYSASTIWFSRLTLYLLQLGKLAAPESMLDGMGKGFLEAS